MSRCGCTRPCPTCPQAFNFEDQDAAIALSVPSVVSSVTQMLVSETINIPAGLPGLGALITADFVACTPAAQPDVLLFWFIALDNVIVERRPLSGNSFTMNPDTCESFSINTAVNLAPGNRTFQLGVNAAALSGTPTLNLTGAGMMIELVRSDQLTLAD